MAQHHRLREAQRPAHQSVVRGKRRGAVHLLQVAEKTAGFPGVGTGTAAACVCRVRASSTGVFHFRLRPDRPPHTGRRHRIAGKHAGRSNQRLSLIHIYSSISGISNDLIGVIPTIGQ